MRRAIHLFAIAAALFLTSVLPAEPQAVVSKVPFADTVLNVCNGEVVDFTGTLTANRQMLTAQNGSIHFIVHFVIIADAVGETSGATYKLQTGDAEWRQWTLSIPTSVNPQLDDTGQNCMVGQRGSIWFLAGVWLGGTAARACSVPEDTTIFFPSRMPSTSTPPTYAVRVMKT